jgi:hypothetical protein
LTGVILKFEKARGKEAIGKRGKTAGILTGAILRFG